MIYYDVYGCKVALTRGSEEWSLYQCTERGVLSPIFDIIIPAEVEESQLAGFLQHAFASKARPGCDRVQPIS